MSQWYISKNGKALGPFSQEEMIGKIKNNEINHLDLVYQSGQSEWQTLNQVDELKKHFQNENTVAKKDKETMAEWVVLKKEKTDKGSEYKQLGPFTEDQVLELIDQGEIRFSDFGWKNGLESWVKISQLEPFSQPLPSSSQIDISIYEKTQPDLNINTLTDAEKRSLTSMVKIERYNHNIEEEVEKTSQKSPKLSHEFATQTDIQVKPNSVSVSEDNVNLWALEPPENTKSENIDLDLDKTVVALRPTLKEKQKIKEQPVKQTNADLKKSESDRKETHKKAPKRKEKKPLSNEAKQWLLACGVFIIAATFLYLSLKPSESEIAYGTNIEIEQSQNTIADLPPPKTEIKADETIREMEKLKISMQEVRKEAQLIQKKADPISPKVPMEQKRNEVKKVANVERVKKVEVVKSKTKVEVQKKNSALVLAPKKNVKAKKETDVQIVKGSAKTKSYYLQRDRKALFYSSLKAETLAVEIQRQFLKLKKDKKAWNQFYGGWKKKVQLSLSNEIRNFPIRSEKYAYPKVFETFKKDYSLFSKYGETFNAKVNGTREPSDAPQDMQRIFSRHKKQAQSLGGVN